MERIHQPKQFKAVFLDVDGVLNRGQYCPDFSEDIELKCLKCLQRLVHKTGAKIIVSSSWRQSEKMLSKLRHKLQYYGMEIHDVTEVLRTRPAEIKAYLNNHPEISDYVVLDDWDMRPDFGNRQVLTVAYHRSGLDNAWTDQAIFVLTNDTDQIN